jgi:glycosyltransferase involved in cell wall biosynthesis
MPPGGGIRVAAVVAAMPAGLRLDVLIPTHNRGSMLERCLASVMRAAPDDAVDVHVTVICNGCTDGSSAIVRRYQAAYPGRITLLEECRRGKSKALNAGIAATGGDLVGMIDDDEEVDVNWVKVIGRVFADPSLDFAGGPYTPVWDAPAPDWIPEEYLAVLGAVDNGPHARPYSREFDGILKGGNAVIRRSVLQRAGRYAEHLGPGSFARLFSCEDEDMYLRLLGLGARGKYFPELVVFHYIAAARLTRAYYRRWCFWRGVSRGLMDRRHPLPVAYLAGIPRFLWGRAARGGLRLLRGGHRSRRDVFTDELRIWDVAGYLYGRHLYTLARLSPVRSRRRGDASAFAGLQAHVRRMDDVELAG